MQNWWDAQCVPLDAAFASHVTPSIPRWPPCLRWYISEFLFYFHIYGDDTAIFITHELRDIGTAPICHIDSHAYALGVISQYLSAWSIYATPALSRHYILMLLCVTLHLLSINTEMLYTRRLMIKALLPPCRASLNSSAVSCTKLYHECYYYFAIFNFAIDAIAAPQHLSAPACLAESVLFDDELRQHDITHGQIIYD